MKMGNRVELIALLLMAGCHGQARVDGPPTTDGTASVDRSVDEISRPEPATIDQAIAGSPLSMELSWHHTGGCAETTVSTGYEGTFTLDLDDQGTGEARLTVEHGDVSTSWVDGRGPERHVSHKRFTWSVTSRRENDLLRLELTPAPGCELVNDTPPRAVFGCPQQTPAVTLACSAQRIRDFDLPSIEPRDGLAPDAVTLRCRDAVEQLLPGALRFMGEDFGIAPSPGVQLTHRQDDTLIQGVFANSER